MIVGTVSLNDTPVISIQLGGRSWLAIVDTGFNSDLELPEAVRPLVNPRYSARMRSALAGGQEVVEDVFFVDFPFDGKMIEAEATFVPGPDIMIGTHLLRDYRLEIHFVNRTVHLERVA